MSRQRGMALIQALLIVAALAAVAAALMLRAGQATERLALRQQAVQASVYLDGAVEQLRATLPRDGPVTTRQPWAQPRAGVRIGDATLSWQVEDLQGRFNLTALLTDPQEAWRDAFVRLARGAGLAGSVARRVAARLAAMPALSPATPWALTEDTETRQVWSDLQPLIAALPDAEGLNVNTLSPAVLAALAPALSGGDRDALLRHVATEPASEIAALIDWARRSLGDGPAGVLAVLPLTTGSRWFLARLEVRLDSLVLRRSVVLRSGGPTGRFAVILSMPEFD
ncbi:MAG: general secretion pathway protein GspK [Rhodobacter sp.]|uniref:hypothetical protein n=1 Tax=Pararhodobacter sp. TaxID=2127056 RepID=UPI001D8BA6D6|nr:hypothetical protein [Pararhodobacter sp.]MCB1345632.1 general secretion pathway protein GspK [Paracoccaceae bacterium]MCC0072851.1 general secretion pathway protein GspK [Rhodobacter sp.]HPD92501.1 type II secretion system protein GspK [Pararhodobacter sp.]